MWYDQRKFMTGRKIIKFQTEIVNGLCPSCEELTMLVGITPEMYRCISCGSDLQQHINGKISYIPALSPRSKLSDLKGYFDGEEI